MYYASGFFSNYFYGFDSRSIYPDYWNDPAIARCPSDAGGDWLGSILTIENDFPEMVRRIGQSNAGTTQERQACLHSKLSLPISYIYTGYLVGTQSQMCDIQITFVNELFNKSSQIVEQYANLSNIDPSCNVPIRAHRMENGQLIWQEDVTATIALFHQSGMLDDDGVTRLPGNYPRLREGVERFLITDIYNPGAAAVGQSEIIVMFDSYANGFSIYSGQGASDASITRFNHVPGGSNILYMDGHVEFKRLEDGFPMLVRSLSPNSTAGAIQNSGVPYWAEVISIFGGSG